VSHDLPVGGDLPATERVAAHTADLDRLETPQLVALLVEEQRGAVNAVAAQATCVAAVVDEIAARIARGGRLHYVGAGSSGRLGALDAAEMPPTFGTDPATVCAHIAGGREALERAVEGAEDDREAGDAAMQEHIGDGDAVIGISAGGGAPFVVGALERARALGAYTVALVNADDAPVARAADVAVVLSTGAEAIAGSTRLKAGTSQKIALNAISTAVMVRLGKVHGNLMIDLVATNRKLRARAVRLVCALADVDETRACELLEQAGGSVKVAVAMEWRGLDARAARALLAERGSVLRSLS
jgi:N-acetylmuramic acid 6-phosphate etherase